MPSSTEFQTKILQLFFENLAYANVGDASGLQPAATAGSVYLSLHTASPGSGGNQTTNEATYTSYARIAIGRAGANFSISGSDPTAIANAAIAAFPACTGGTNTITHFAVGSATSGTGHLYFFGTVTPNLAVSNGITPQFAIGQMSVTVI